MFATADLLQVSARALLDKQFPWLRAAEKRAGCEPASARGTGLTTCGSIRRQHPKE